MRRQFLRTARTATGLVCLNEKIFLVEIKLPITEEKQSYFRDDEEEHEQEVVDNRERNLVDHKGGVC